MQNLLAILLRCASIEADECIPTLRHVRLDEMEEARELRKDDPFAVALLRKLMKLTHKSIKFRAAADGYRTWRRCFCFWPDAFHKILSLHGSTPTHGTVRLVAAVFTCL